MTPLMTATEVGKLLRMNKATVLHRVQQRRLGCVRDGRKILFAERHIEAYLAANEVAMNAPQSAAQPRSGTAVKPGICSPPMMSPSSLATTAAPSCARHETGRSDASATGAS